MGKIKKILESVRKHIPLNKASLTLLLVCSVLLLWGAVRACSGGAVRHDRRVYRIGRDINWYPLNLMGKEKEMLGFTSDVLMTIANKQGINVEMRNVGSNTLFYGLQKGNYDAIISSLIPTSHNLETYAFSDTIYSLGPVLIVRNSSPYSSLEKMNDRIIGVNRGSNIVFDIAQYNVRFAAYDSMTVAFDDLNKGKIDGILLPSIEAYSYVTIFYPGKLKIVTTPLSPEALRLVTMRSPHANYLIEKFNIGLKELKEDGTYDKFLKKWGLVNPDLTK
ncbi:MAG: amino acid ABC transporter substrate-binding protein [Chlamydiales bacterium]|nr:amino acid ABC transporter substrate-binding protein [Chlamydiia bacterium]MCP5508360.1 amino acid ABC transporter substrate-binding protein [Chlamydiales bacterium]